MRSLAVAALTVFIAACGSVVADGALDAGSPDSPPGPDARALDAGADGGLGAPDASPDTSPDAPADAGSDALVDGCPSEMARIRAFCVDRYEAHVVRVESGGERPQSPYGGLGDASVRAKSAPGVVPQGYISQIEATDACAAAGKRLCGAEELALACRGEDADALYPYGGTTRMPGKCNEGRGTFMPLLFGTNPALWTYENLNDPRLNQLDGGLAKTGSYPDCRSPYGVYDCVGNLHEWSSEPPDERGRGRFRGGFYGDSEINGRGCRYVTSAHEPTYHDYSTGFRCCRDSQ